MGQKAPSTKRCIKTCHLEIGERIEIDGQKAPSAKRCIKTVKFNLSSQVTHVFTSESTERQKVH